MTDMSRNRLTQPTDPENDPLVSQEARDLARASWASRSARPACHRSSA
jgi:hypothetical protein